jgi:hypothetical protein
MRKVLTEASAYANTSTADMQRAQRKPVKLVIVSCILCISW